MHVDWQGRAFVGITDPCTERDPEFYPQWCPGPNQFPDPQYGCPPEWVFVEQRIMDPTTGEWLPVCEPPWEQGIVHGRSGPTNQALNAANANLLAGRCW